MNLQIRNPHSILAALKSRPQDVLDIALPPSFKGQPDGDDIWDRVASLAREHRVKTRVGASSGAQKQRGQGHSKGDAGRVGSSEATVRERAPLTLEEIFDGAAEKSGGQGLWIALDCLQDPQNVGAIFRSASFFGVQGIIMTQERSAPLTGTAYDVASGGVEDVPFASVVNLQRTFEKAKAAGLWILGTSEHAPADIRSVEKDRPWLLVLGNEEKGLRRLTEDACDVLCKVPSRGEVTSLNVSVAAGIFISRLT